MLLNNYSIVDRHNRPAVGQRVGLRAFFINDGQFQDPYALSAVTLFEKAENLSPSTLLNDDGLLKVTLTADQILMNFGISSLVGQPGPALDASNYVPGTQASGIYRISTGQYIVVLDGTVNLSGAYNLNGSGLVVANACSAAADYLDVWTVKLLQNSDWKTIINPFTLYDGTYFVVTQPILFTVTNRLTNKYIRLGEKVDLKITTETHIDNKDIPENILNIWKDSAITSASVEIKKLNEEPTLGARVTVSSFSDTVGYVDVTSDDTMIFSWDTSRLYTHPQTLAGNMGSLVGEYSVQAKFTLLNETKYTPLFILTIR